MEGETVKDAKYRRQLEKIGREIEKENWVKVRIFKNKYEALFRDLSKDLNNILVCYQYDGKMSSLNKLKLELDNIMNRYKNKMYEVQLISKEEK